MPYEFFDHTADVGVDLAAPTREGIFEQAVRAFTDAVTPLGGVEAARERVIEVTADSLEELMIEWLEEHLYLFEVEQWLTRRSEVALHEAEDGWTLQARVRGETYDPDRHPVKVLVKGITFHQLTVEPRDDGWFGRVIFDI